MTQKQENAIILGIFTLLFVTVLGFNIFSVTENIRPAGSAPALTIPPRAPSSLEAKKSPGTQPPGLISRQEAAAGTWGRDPFASSWLREERQTTNAVLPEMSAEDLTVTLILISETKRIVAINHKIYQEGDMVRGEKVAAIKRDAVVLEKDGTRRLLSLPKSVVQF